jgi:peptidoglycan hydrolase-like protein with peptidoglycan-binding domain
MLLPNQANKRAGYVSTSTFTEITTTCSSDSQLSGDSLSDEGECKIDSNSDLVIWTKHFTTFATYSQTATPSSGGGSVTSGGSYFIYNSPSPSYSGGSSSGTSNVSSPTLLAAGNTNSSINTNTSSNNTTSNQITTTEILSFGSVGSDVETLQVFLFNNGYLSAEPNGRFGPQTEKAVKRFQAKYADELLTPQGFKNPTGMVGDATRKKINEIIASEGKVVSSTPGVPSRGNTLSKKITTTEILSFGSEGVDVEVLQVFLFNNEFLSVEPNGHFGPATEKAVKRFQAKYADELLTPQGFKNPTGMVGEATRNKINEMIDVQ